ncbi:MAG TPA: GtrA family protein [Actinocrinis sp.]|nr:GtrA family protein [Actinocrinis sp.]
MTIEPRQDGIRAESARIPASRTATARAAVEDLVRRLWREMVGFGLVGLVGVTCDIITFNVVLQVMHEPKVVASLCGTGLGTVVGYLGNRFWVFRRRDRRQSTAELLLFILVSVIGMGITAVCVAFNDHVLGNHSVLSANVAQFIFGQGLGTIFRFWACHRWVFPEAAAEAGEPFGELAAVAADLPLVVPAAQLEPSDG